jgi:hypothetical protein
MMRLFKHEYCYLATGPAYKPADRIPTAYEFLGLPRGQKAFAKRTSDGHWQMQREMGDVIGPWTGDFRTADVILLALEAEFDCTEA